MSPICVLIYFWFHVEWNHQKNLENMIIQKCRRHSSSMKCPISCYYFDKFFIELYSLIYFLSILFLSFTKINSCITNWHFTYSNCFLTWLKITLVTIFMKVFIVLLHQIVSNKCLSGIIQKSWIIKLPVCSFPTISCKRWNVRSFIIWSPSFSCI